MIMVSDLSANQIFEHRQNSSDVKEKKTIIVKPKTPDSMYSSDVCCAFH